MPLCKGKLSVYLGYVYSTAKASFISLQLQLKCLCTGLCLVFGFALNISPRCFLAFFWLAAVTCFCNLSFHLGSLWICIHLSTAMLQRYYSNNATVWKENWLRSPFCPKWYWTVAANEKHYFSKKIWGEKELRRKKSHWDF